MVSPLSKIAKQPVSVATAQPMVSLQPLDTIQTKKTFLPTQSSIGDGDIDKLGADISKEVGKTTEKIIEKMAMSNFDELGKMLVAVQAEVGKLDPTSIKKTGIVGWFQDKFGDIKQELTLRLKKADAVFDSLSEKIANHITVHTEWIKDLENLYLENMDRYKTITETMDKAEQWKAILKNQIDNWEVIQPDDPDAGMKIQNKRDMEARLNRLSIKIDSFNRLKAVANANAPKIKNQIDTSRVTVMTLKDVVEQTIPMIKMEFSMYIQSLDAQKSIQLVNSAKDLANTTLKKSADSAKQAAVDASTALNSPMIETETLMHIKNRMLETLVEVKQIEQTAEQSRIADAQTINNSQKEFLANLQKMNGV